MRATAHSEWVVYQEELKVTDNRDATKSSYKQEMQKRVAKQVNLRTAADPLRIVKCP